MFTEFTRLCPSCSVVVPDPPAAPVCPQCARVLVIHHSQWAPRLKWFLLAMFVRSLLMPWQTEQDLWETLLRNHFSGVRAGKGPNPKGVHLTTSTPTVEFYPLAEQESIEWKAAGSPITLGAEPAPSPVQRTGT